MLLRLTIEYDGTAFHGWARQPGRRTVEGVLRDGLATVFRHSGELAVAGRTDAGVHAAGQVASVDVAGGPPPERAAEALNTVLPGDVAVLDAVAAAPGFHARHSATGRSYRYVVLNRRARSALDARRALWWPRAFPDVALQDAAAALVGEHDFRAFTPAETQHEAFRRNVRDAAWERRGDHVHFTITANSFLRHMVRTLVGTMLELGDDAPRRIPELLEGRPRADAGMTAPPWGLTLERVHYSSAVVQQSPKGRAGAPSSSLPRPEREGAVPFRGGAPGSPPSGICAPQARASGLAARDGWSCRIPGMRRLASAQCGSRSCSSTSTGR